MFFARPFVAAAVFGLTAAAGFSGNDANAQQIYRIVGPDGRVTFTDKAPIDGSTRAANSAAAPGGTNTSALPFELRQAASRFPVVLYSSPDCGPCGSGRALLSSRGVPFLEKTVTTNDDIEALKRLAGAASVPFLTIGGQQLKGFSEIEWVQYLDAAGYPKSSQLPAGYTQARATPLVAIQQPQAPSRSAAAAPPPVVAVPPTDPQPIPSTEGDDNPNSIANRRAAIRF